MENMESPYFVATSTSAKQLFLLLRCVAVGGKDKIQLQIGPDGLSFSVEDSSVMESMVFLRKSLFSTYQCRSDRIDPFSFSLTSLLEALQMFGISEMTKPTNAFWSNTPDAFSTLAGLCRISYNSPGSLLQVILEEPRITTKCELTTYTPSTLAEIPFAREELSLKAIMNAPYLYEVILEMSNSNPDIMIISTSDEGLELSCPNNNGAITFQFGRKESTILEIFMASDDPFRQSYKFSNIASTKRALSSAIKVSLRADHQGVLSLQFMIENIDGIPGVSFIDFVFIPLIDDENEN